MKRYNEMIKKGASKKEALKSFAEEGVSQSVIKFISEHEPEEAVRKSVKKIQHMMIFVLILCSLVFFGFYLYDKWYWGYQLGWNEYFLSFKIIMTLLTTLFLSFLYRGAMAYLILLDFLWMAQEISLGDQEEKKLLLVTVFSAAILVYILLVISKRVIRYGQSI